MAREFHFQDPGEGIREAEVLEVLVSKGESIEQGQDVFVVETDKAAFEVASSLAGTVEEVLVSEGDTIHVGDPLLRIADDEAGEKAPEEPTEGTGDAQEAQQEREQREAKEKKEKEREAKKKASKPEVDATRGARSGREADRPARETQGAEARRDRRPVPASPATRRVARELGVDLREVEASGEEGRVLTDDVRAHARRAKGATQGEPARGRGEAPPERPALPDFSRFGPVRRERLRSIRRTTAQRMARSWREIPHVTHHDLADVTELEAFRRRHAGEIEQAGGKLTFTVLAMKATVAALREHPRFNSSLDTEREELVLKDYYHLGVAFDSERGLLVPTLRDVDRKSLRELAVELAELGERVRRGEVSREDMSGSSFTLTNVGPLGGTTFTPIINHPEVAILGMGRARLQPVVYGSAEEPEIRARLLLPLSLGYDHRVNDGADAARFLNRIMEVLGDPESLALAV